MSAFVAERPSYRAVRATAVIPGAKTPRRNTAALASAIAGLKVASPGEIARDAAQHVHAAANVIAKNANSRRVVPISARDVSPMRCSH